MFIIPIQIVQTAVIIINAVSVWLVFLVSNEKTSNRITNLFTAMIVLMLIWVNFAFLARTTPSEIGLTFIRLAWSITPFFFSLIYIFVEDLFSPTKKLNFLKKIVVLIGFLNIPLVLFTDLIIFEIWLTGRGVININYGALSWGFFSQVLIISGLVINSLSRKLWLEKNEREKNKIKYLLVGFSFFLIMNSIFNIILPVFFQSFNLYAFGDYSTIFFLSCIAYAMTKENLFGVKVLFSTMAIGVMVILLLVDITIFTPNILSVQIFKIVTLILFLIFGYILIRSVISEINKREELEKLSDELVETNIKLKDANKKLKRLDKAKSEFISIASHQLRTPLTAVKGYLSMVEDGSYGEISDEAKNKIKDIQESAQRLISLVNDLLSISRIESGKIEMVFKDVDIIKFVEGLISEMEIVAKNKNLYLKLENFCKEDKSIVQIDEDRLRQVILNIIDNAIKYTKNGGINIRLKIQEVKSGKNSLLIEINDTGEGMSRKDISNIFESFSRGSAGDLMHSEGAGLGLYIARKFVDMHNGSIWIKSPGKGLGTTFFIELPINQ